jgi:hypothetical protein
MVSARVTVAATCRSRMSASAAPCKTCLLVCKLTDDPAEQFHRMDRSAMKSASADDRPGPFKLP